MTRKDYTERTNEIVQMVQSANFTWEDYQEAVNYSPWINRVEWWIHENPNDDGYEHVLTPFTQGNYMEASYFNICVCGVGMEITEDEFAQYFADLKADVVAGIIARFQWNMKYMPELFEKE